MLQTITIECLVRFLLLNFCDQPQSICLGTTVTLCRWLDLFSNGWVRHLGEFHESKSGMFEEELVLMLGCGVAGSVIVANI